MKGSIFNWRRLLGVFAIIDFNFLADLLSDFVSCCPAIVIKMFGRVTFYPTLMYNVFMERMSSRRWFDRIDETVVLGALPFRNVAKQLVGEERVKGVVSMNEDFELRFWVPTRPEWKSMGVDFLQLNTPDILHAPSQEKLRQGVDFIKQFESSGNSVYIHCKAGRTRSATLVGCYLMQKHNWLPKDAVALIKSKRQHILLRSKQWQALDTYHKENVLNRENSTANVGIS